MLFAIRLLRTLAIVAIIIGALFKIQHWPSGHLILIAGMIGLALVVLAEFIVSELSRKRK